MRVPEAESRVDAMAPLREHRRRDAEAVLSIGAGCVVAAIGRHVRTCARVRCPPSQGARTRLAHRGGMKGAPVVARRAARRGCGFAPVHRGVAWGMAGAGRGPPASIDVTSGCPESCSPSSYRAFRIGVGSCGGRSAGVLRSLAIAVATISGATAVAMARSYESRIVSGVSLSTIRHMIIRSRSSCVVCPRIRYPSMGWASPVRGTSVAGQSERLVPSIVPGASIVPNASSLDSSSHSPNVSTRAVSPWSVWMRSNVRWVKNRSRSVDVRWSHRVARMVPPPCATTVTFMSVPRRSCNVASGGFIALGGTGDRFSRTEASCSLHRCGRLPRR